MQLPELTFKKIYEHDIDLLLMEELAAEQEFVRLFLHKTQLDCACSVVSISHSLSDADGESDITVVLQRGDQKIALLIEDKIDAPTMKGQSARYHCRAQAAVRRGEYSDYRIVLVAPASYHEEHKKDINADYPYRVTYEELLAYFHTRSDYKAIFKAAMIAFAIKEKKAGYQVQEVAAVTRFWRELRRYCAENYPYLELLGEDTPKGKSACWPEFRTSLKNVKVIYKSQTGTVDLEVPGYGEKTGTLRAIMGNWLTTDMRIRQTGKSAAVRLVNEQWKTDFSLEFLQQKENIDNVLNAVECLCRLTEQFNYSDFY